MAITNALIKAGQSALTKGTEKAIEKATQSAITKAVTDTANKAVTKAITRSLTGAGISSLSPKAGSTLDGILGRSSGLVLPETKIVPKSLYERSGGKYNTIGDAMSDLDYSLADIKSDKTLSKKNLDLLDKNTREIADINNSALDAVGATAKSNLPMLNRDQYYEETLGRVGKNGVMSADVPDYMQSHLSNPKDAGGAFARGSNDEILRDLFQDQTSPISELYDRYDKLASSGNANEIFTPENVDQAIELANYDKSGAGDAITQDFADRAFGNKRDIAVSGGSSPAKKVKVSRPTADMGVEEAVAETNTPIADFTPNVIEPKTAIGGAGRGNGGGTPTATASPDYGGLGDSGFNVHLKDGRDIDIKLKQPMSKDQIKRNRAIRNLDDAWAKGLNATKKQYGEVVAKSKSDYKGYKTPAEMARLNGISLDNINETPQAVIDAFEKRKLNIEKYAEDRGVNVKLDNLDLTNIEPATKATMKMQGIDPDKIKYTGVASPLEAETLYKDLRNRAMKTTDGDRAVAYNTLADYVRNQIDNTMDNLNIDFSAEMSDALGEALGQNADRRYLRGIATNKNLKFSDLRREQADWIKVGNLSGNPMKEEPTINIFGINTGARNPFTAGADKIKEKFYERQAYGPGGSGGAGSNFGGGSVPPTGGSGAENNINFTTVGGGRTGTLGNLLGKAKNAGLVGAGVLGGMALGGGGGGSNSGSTDFSAMSYSPNTTAEPEIDPYSTMTIGGYTYDQLENGYTAALMAGDSDAAKLIANMMGMLDDKIERYNTAKEKSSDSSGIASKQKAALNVLSGLMGNYQAQGPIGGRFTQFMNTITGGGYNPAVSAYDSGASGSLGTIIKALGDTGALSEGDQKRALELLPKTTDSEQAAKMKYQQLIQILQGAGAQ